MTGEEYELYDLEDDPGEKINLADRHPERVAQMAAVLSEWYAGGAPAAEPGRALDPATLAPDDARMLRDLGYLDDERE